MLEKENYDFEKWYGVDDFIKTPDNKNMGVILTGITNGMVVPGITAKKASSFIINNGRAEVVDYIF